MYRNNFLRGNCMTFGEYVETLIKSGLLGKNRGKLGVTLFKYAGSRYDVSEESVRAWMHGRRNCDVERYFPERTMNGAGFISGLKELTPKFDSWKKIQNAFREKKTANPMDKDFCVNTETDDRDKFYWSLSIQFQNIFGLHDQKQEENNPTVPVTTTPQKLSPGQMREWFLDAADRYRIMEIINKKPAIYGWTHSAYLNLFLKEMDPLILNCAQSDDKMCASIKSFINSLYRKAEILERNLSKRFDFEDETASFNMENDNEVTADSEADLNSLGLPKLSDVIKAAVADIIVGGNDNDDDDDDDNDDDIIVDDDYILNLLKLDMKPWGAFRREMCTLYDKIFLWQDKL